MSWLLTIAGICMLIVLHEGGHFAVAKAVGMRVERFSLFFPPTIARVRRGETEYAIGALPLGGYVKITGMSPDEIARLEPEVAARAYYNQTPWKRIAVILAGPAVNLVLAFVIFWALLIASSDGAAITIDNITNGDIATLHSTSTVAEVEGGAPAAHALRAGDRIISIDGHRASVPVIMQQVATHTCRGAAKAGCRARTPVALSVLRDGRTLALSIYPRYDATLKRMLLGFGFGVVANHVGALAAAHTALDEMWTITRQTLTNFVHAITSPKVRHQLVSIVGITQITQQAIGFGPGYALVILGWISLVLAVLNLFPFLPLDGGHVLWSLAERVRGKRVSLAAMVRFSTIGILLLAFIVINGVSNDISRLTGS